jgi:hypothetical protein
MKYLLQLAPVLLLLASCQSNPTTPDTATVAVPDASKPQPVKVEPVKVEPVKVEATKPEPDNPEFIEDAMVTVNGRPNEELTTRQLKKQMGRPDSIAKGAVECGGNFETMNGPDGDFWYYGKTMYEVNGTRAILYSFDVTTAKFQGKVGKLVLNRNTTLEDARRFFPLSAKEADKPATGRPGEVMSLPFYYKGTPVEASLILVFKKGRLQEVEFWSPC